MVNVSIFVRVFARVRLLIRVRIFEYQIHTHSQSPPFMANVKGHSRGKEMRDIRIERDTEKRRGKIGINFRAAHEEALP